MIYSFKTEDFLKPIGLLLVLLGMLRSSGETDGAVLRTKRDLLSFSMMVAYKTGRSALEFNNYGRFCGLLGSGKTVDGVDDCCSAHDQCYDTATGKDGVCNEWGSYGPYWIRYTWYTMPQPNGSVVCIHEDMRSNKFADCAYDICECDNEVTSCFARNGYNPTNQKTLMWRVMEATLVTKFNLTGVAVHGDVRDLLNRTPG